MKRDLNLIPKIDSTPIFTKYLLPVLLLVVLYAATGYMAWSIPSEKLHAKEIEDTELTQKVEELAYVEVEYQNLRGQISEIEAKKETVAQTTSSIKSALSILELLEGSSPDSLVISQLALAEDGITIQGHAPSNTTIAEFAVNLRNIDRFSMVNITSVIPISSTFEEIQTALSQGEDIPDSKMFIISISYADDETLKSLDEGADQ